MAATTYVSISINNAQKEAAALDAIVILVQHIKSGATGYPAHLFSIVFDQTTLIITVILSGPLPSDQVSRYGLTLSA